MKTDKRVDAYISKAAPFAQEVLTEVRARVHKAAPDIEETIKWNVPFFLSGGRMVASMAAFKAHLKVGVWADGKPKMIDVKTVKELGPAAAFVKAVKAAAVEKPKAKAKK